MHVHRSRTSFAAPLVIAAALTFGACSKTDSGAAKTDSAAAAGNTTAAKCPGDNAGLTLPAGFCATIFAESLGKARDVAIADNGDVYITIDGSQPAQESDAGPKQERPKVSVIALRDSTHDGKADVMARIGTIGNTGVALFNGYLFVDEGTQIVRYKREANELTPSGKREVVVSGLPLNPGHRARNIAIGKDGALYVNVGSATNSCQQKDRQNDSPGIDPCVELRTRAGTWKFDANKTGQAFSQSARFATGIRNGMGLTINPADGMIWQTQHGRDQLNQNWGKIFPDPKYSAQNPGEELMQVNQGDDFGWPYCYYSVDEKKLVDAPEYGGDGKKSARCDSKKAPVAAFPGHWAPMSVMFYTGSQFPEKYRNGVFIAFHGSWNRAPEPQEGYRVVFQPLLGGKAEGNYETFANGFAGVPDNELQPGTAKHRPVGLATLPDGSLLVTDDTGGLVYRITYGAK
jgi:glucose/arabinose dehydrogenase